MSQTSKVLHHGFFLIAGHTEQAECSWEAGILSAWFAALMTQTKNNPN